MKHKPYGWSISRVANLVQAVAAGLAAIAWLISATRPFTGTLDAIVPELADIGRWNMLAAALSCIAAIAHAVIAGRSVPQ